MAQAFYLMATFLVVLHKTAMEKEKKTSATKRVPA